MPKRTGAEALQEFHLGERFLLRDFRQYSARQPYRVSEKPGSEGYRTSTPTKELNMAKSPLCESPMQANQEPRPRHRNVYDYDGEYEFVTAQHWTAPDEAARRRYVRFSTRPVGGKSDFRF
jgi:hypothetical protein